MKNLVTTAICFLLIFTGPTIGQTFGLIAGATTVDGKPLPNVTVRLRSLDNGQLVGNTTASPTGQFSFPGLTPGNYVVEMVSADGTILGTSVNIPLTTTVMAATNVSVGVSAAALGAAGVSAAASGVAAAGAGAAGAGLSATLIAVSAVGVTLGTTAIVAVADDASPSR